MSSCMSTSSKAKPEDYVRLSPDVVWRKSINHGTSVVFNFFDYVRTMDEACVHLRGFYGAENVVAARRIFVPDYPDFLFVEIAFRSPEICQQAQQIGIDIKLRQTRDDRTESVHLQATATLDPEQEYTAIEIFNLPLESPAEAILKVEEALRIHFTLPMCIKAIHPHRQAATGLFQGRIAVLVEGKKSVIGRRLYVPGYGSFFPVAFNAIHMYCLNCHAADRHDSKDCPYL